jgi:hypothetical protein
MQFENGMWQSAWDVFRINWKTVALAIAAATVLDLLAEYSGKTGGFGVAIDVIIWSMVAISAHGVVLLGSADVGFSGGQKTFWPFVWRSLVLLLLCLVPFGLAWIMLHDGDNIYLSMLKALPVLGLAALVVFALLGTWLPAVVVNGDRSIGAAAHRGGRSFAYAAPRLLLGPGLLQTLTIGLILLAAMRGVVVGEVFGATGFSVSDLISLPIIYTARAFTVTLVAVILSRTYLMTEQAMAQTRA